MLSGSLGVHVSPVVFAPASLPAMSASSTCANVLSSEEENLGDNLAFASLSWSGPFFSFVVVVRAFVVLVCLYVKTGWCVVRLVWCRLCEMTTNDASASCGVGVCWGDGRQGSHDVVTECVTRALAVVLRLHGPVKRSVIRCPGQRHYRCDTCQRWLSAMALVRWLPSPASW